jgi:hypothetical protein
MKKFLACIMVLFFAVSVVSAGLLSFGFGANALNDVYTGDEETDSLLNTDSYRFGMEARLGVLFAEASISALYGPEITAPGATIEGLATVGLSMDIFNLLHFGLGVGPYFGARQDGANWILLYGDSDSPQEATDLQQILDGSTIYYRAHADLKFGKMSFGVTVQVPSDGYTLTSTGLFSELDLLPVWDKAKYGASVLFWLF